jgi:hypothetical protein
MALADAHASTPVEIDTIAYARDMLTQLRALVVTNDRTLAYLIDMARAHAEQEIARRRQAAEMRAIRA